MKKGERRGGGGVKQTTNHSPSHNESRSGCSTLTSFNHCRGKTGRSIAGAKQEGHSEDGVPTQVN